MIEVILGAIIKELKTQAGDNSYDKYNLYIGDEPDTDVCIDGYVNLRAVARAVAEAIATEDGA